MRQGFPNRSRGRDEADLLANWLGVFFMIPSVNTCPNPVSDWLKHEVHDVSEAAEVVKKSATAIRHQVVGRSERTSQLPADGLAAVGVGQRQFTGMQQQPVGGGERDRVGIERIAQDGMTDRRQMQPDLM